MNYRQLQLALKAAKAKGFSSIRLTEKMPILLAEYDRLVEAGQISAITQEDSAPQLTHSVTSQRPTATPQTSNEVVPASEEVTEGETKPSQEIAAAVAESWTDNPSLAIAIFAAYTVAGFAMAVLWLALIATTLLLSCLKSCRGIRGQIATLKLQLKYFEPPFEIPSIRVLQFGPAPLRPLLIH